MADPRKRPPAARQAEATPQVRALLYRAKAVVAERFPVLPVRGAPPAIAVPDDAFDLRAVRQLAPELARLSALVCRIDVAAGGRSLHQGTGVLVAGDVVLTCRHVVASFAMPGPRGWDLVDPAAGAVARFDPVPDGGGGTGVPVSQVLFAATDSGQGLDYRRDEPELALLRLARPVTAVAPDAGMLNWSTDFEADADARACAVISYPGDPFTTDAAGRKVFADVRLRRVSVRLVEGQFEPDGRPLYGTCCLTIGAMRLATLPNDGHRLFASHDCSTLAGASGGGVVDLSSGKIVGIHCGGEFGGLNQFQLFSAALGRIGRREELRAALAAAGVPGF